jgi:hypothetical protein
VLLIEDLELIGVELGVAVVDLHRAEQHPVVFAELLLSRGDHVPIRQQLLGGRGRRRQEECGDRRADQESHGCIRRRLSSRAAERLSKGITTSATLG